MVTLRICMNDVSSEGSIFSGSFRDIVKALGIVFGDIGTSPCIRFPLFFVLYRLYLIMW